MLFADRIPFDQPRKTQDGYLVVRARAARAGIYEYNGKEVDPSGDTFSADQVVRVYRPEEEVFAQDSVASFLMKPVTNDHPAKPVTADNWRDYAKGVVGKALRDGEYLAFDIVLMDKDIIADVEGGKRELSNGYASLIEFTAGQTPEGSHYDAIQREIRGNHVAVVDKGRAGSHCRIGDEVPCVSLPASELIEILTDGQTYSAQNRDGKNEPERNGEVMMPHTLVIDGLQVTEVSDQAKAAIEKLQGQVRDAVGRADKAEGQVATLTTDKATLEAKVTTLEQQVKDAKLSPAQLRDAAKSYSQVVDKAKALGVEVTDDMDEAAIMKTAVTAKLGDAATDWTDEQFAASFASLTKDAPGRDPVREVISDGVRTKVTDDGASVRNLARAAQY